MSESDIKAMNLVLTNHPCFKLAKESNWYHPLCGDTNCKNSKTCNVSYHMSENGNGEE